MTVVFKNGIPTPPTLDPPATERELAWWKATRRDLVRQQVLRATGLIAVYFAGSMIGGRAGRFSDVFRVVGAILAVTLVVLLTYSALRGADETRDILAKRAAEELSERQQEFLAALDAEARDEGADPSLRSG